MGMPYLKKCNNAGIKCLVQWLPAGIFSGVFKFQCMLFEKKIISDRLFLQI